MAAHPPTGEQQAALDLFATGANLVIKAGAGTGKTSTLLFLAQSTRRRGQGIAFNRPIVDENSRKFPGTCNWSTAHSLAVRAVGGAFEDRKRQGKRARTIEVAARLGIDAIRVPTPGGDDESKLLSPTFLAGLVMRAVKQFCKTPDLAPDRSHVPPVKGLEDDANALVARHLETALRRAWADLSNPEGGLPFTTDIFFAVCLKLWQLSEPLIPADYILFDECQPPDTMVALAGGRGFKKITDLEVGERVVSYTKGNIVSSKFGSVVLGKSNRPFDGQLVVVSAVDGAISRYTPNHIAMAKIGDAFEGKYLLYLMRQGERYRVGVTQAHHGTGPGRSTGLIGRLREEKGDAAWILSVFDSRAEALAAEQMSSLQWRIPQVRFESPFWDSWPTDASDVQACAEKHGRDLRYPLVDRTRRYMLADRFTEIRAANLMDGMQVRLLDGTLQPITVTRHAYSGNVVSLTVSGPATYIADGIVTHNCQDANPVMAAVVALQGDAAFRARHGMRPAQLVYVGDDDQAINGFTGAINAMAAMEGARTMLTQSFRFGPAVAAVANHLLALIPGSEMRVRGFDRIASTVGLVAEPDAILTRTNACAVEAVLEAQQAGRVVHLVGGGTDVVAFAKAARDLQSGIRTDHEELACFEDWNEVLDYVANDEQGSEIELLVKLVERFGVDTILAALEHPVREQDAELVVSTAHKSKGRQWGSVKIGSDFPEGRIAAGGDDATDELRLLYVAVTRAQFQLDVTDLPFLRDLTAPRFREPAAAALPAPARERTPVRRSQHVGTPGASLTLDGVRCDSVKGMTTKFGWTHLTRLTDPATGNVFKAFLDEELEPGRLYDLDCRVKGHDEFRGVDETQINYVTAYEAEVQTAAAAS